ncbi:MAG: segregation/condensation protein A [Rhizobiales bacterium]|nr:segregation/condensation protein A [Hyphomicrobiales bacterium]
MPAAQATAPQPAQAEASSGFVVDLDGFEGPVDLLLNLARQQKVDLAKISVLALAEQYLTYIQQARDLKLEIAADYLVTAAWLTYLKSRLLLPPPHDDDEPSGEELAEALTERLQRLDAIRRAADMLFTRPRLGIERFPRGQPEGLRILRKSRYRLLLHELLQAYLDQRSRGSKPDYRITAPPVMRMEEAIERITGLLGGPDWHSLLAFLPADLMDESFRRSVIAAHVGASLEMARDGLIELRQAAPFGPIYVRRRSRRPEPA